MKNQDPDEAEPDAVEIVLGECLSCPAAERPETIEAACRRHPELAEELRRRLAVLEDLGVLEHGAGKVPDELGDFRLLARIGGGGMGVVYRAEQTSLKREVALKLIRPEQLYFPGARERFRREAEAVGRLNHPNIVPIYTVGDYAGLPYFAMELVRGCTMAQALHALHGRDPASLNGADLYRAVAAHMGLQPALQPPTLARKSWVDTCLQLVQQMALALQHVHEHALLHRDVKPSNILIGLDGCGYLCDFGLTHQPTAEPVTRTGSQLGTVPYMSPEQSQGKQDLDARTDVYSLGVTLYELLSLQQPYAGDSVTETLRLIEAGQADSLRARNRRVAEDVETVCLVSMERDRVRRYRTAGEFAADLGALLERRPIRAKRSGFWLRTRRLVERRPAASLGLTLGLAMVVGFPIQRFLHERELRLAADESIEQLRRENELTARSTHFVLDLLRRAGSNVPVGEPLRVAHVLAFGLQTIEKELGDDPLARARAELLLGKALLSIGEKEAARTVLERAQATFEAGQRFIEQRGLWDALLLGAQADIALGESNRAETRLDQLEESLKWAPAPDPPLRRSVRMTRAWISIERREFENAGETLATVLAELEAGGEAEGIELGRVLGFLGSGLIAADRKEEALEPLERAVMILGGEFGLQDPELLNCLSNLGLTQKKLGRLDEAAASYMRAAELAEALWTGPNESAAMLYINIGALEDQRGRYESALSFYDRSSAVWKALGMGSSQLSMVAGISSGVMLMRLERFAEAEARLARWHQAQRTYLGAGHPFVVRTFLHRATCLGKLARVGEALELLDSGLEELAAGETGAVQEGLRRELEALGDHLVGADN